jgi:hypothetical protein
MSDTEIFASKLRMQLTQVPFFVADSLGKDVSRLDLPKNAFNPDRFSETFIKAVQLVDERVSSVSRARNANVFSTRDTIVRKWMDTFYVYLQLNKKSMGDAWRILDICVTAANDAIHSMFDVKSVARVETPYQNFRMEAAPMPTLTLLDEKKDMGEEDEDEEDEPDLYDLGDEDDFQDEDEVDEDDEDLDSEALDDIEFWDEDEDGLEDWEN